MGFFRTSLWNKTQEVFFYATIVSPLAQQSRIEARPASFTGTRVSERTRSYDGVFIPRDRRRPWTENLFREPCKLYGGTSRSWDVKVVRLGGDCQPYTITMACFPT